MLKKYFSGSLWFTVIALVLATVVGYMYGGWKMALTYFISASLLAILEVSVSLDNAVVNSKILEFMNDKWRHLFLTVGMFIAVFGMRLVLPLAIVSIASHVNPWDAFLIALFKPDEYQTIITSVHMEIMAFGGSFLFMIFAAHFIDKEKEEHWIPFIGPFLSKIGKHSTANVVIPFICILVFSRFVENSQGFLMAAMWGLVLYLLVDGLGAVFEVEGAAQSVGKSGIAGFIYLEFVDASFSFDGVIAAFAITNNFIIIMLGLSIGAMFVRSLTIMLVEKGTLSEFRYLEDGAFWGIGWLVVSMFLSVIHIELGELVVAGGCAIAIALATWHSIILNKREKLQEAS